MRKQKVFFEVVKVYGDPNLPHSPDNRHVAHSLHNALDEAYVALCKMCDETGLCGIIRNTVTFKVVSIHL